MTKNIANQRNLSYSANGECFKIRDTALIAQLREEKKSANGVVD